MQPSLAVGSEPLPGYRLIKPLGRGGFGEVWMAEAPGDIRVALKFISVEGGRAGPELRALEVVRNVRHPHLLDIQFAVQEGGWLVIASSLCDASLWDLLLRSQEQGLPGIPADELLVYMAESAEALDFLNEPRHKDAGGNVFSVRHRDVKPHNIFVVGGSVKVADFGLAKILERSVASHTGCMTPAYAPPEMFQGQVSSHSDQYSLAVTYCQLRGGQMPFGGNLVQLMYGHLHGAPDLSGLPEAERPVVARALAKEPGGRWESCSAFVEQLRLAAAPPPAAPGPAKAGPAGGEPPGPPAWTRYLRPLVAKLNPTCRRALENAAALTLRRTHYLVDVEHWLSPLIESRDNDVAEIFRHFRVDAKQVSAGIDRCLGGMRAGNPEAPALCFDVVDALHDAWMMSSVHYEFSQVRSGALLLAMAALAGGSRLRSVSAELDKIDWELLRTDFLALTAESAEAGPRVTGPARPAPAVVGKAGSDARKDRTEAGLLREALFARCGGDADLVRRVTEYERRQLPYAGETELLRAAIQRWDRDNR